MSVSVTYIASATTGVLIILSNGETIRLDFWERLRNEGTSIWDGLPRLLSIDKVNRSCCPGFVGSGVVLASTQPAKPVTVSVEAAIISFELFSSSSMEWDTCGTQSVSEMTIVGGSLELFSGSFSPLVVNSSESLEVLGDCESLADISGSEVDEILLSRRPSSKTNRQ